MADFHCSHEEDNVWVAALFDEGKGGWSEEEKVVHGRRRLRIMVRNWERVNVGIRIRLGLGSGLGFYFLKFRF